MSNAIAPFVSSMQLYDRGNGKFGGVTDPAPSPAGTLLFEDDFSSGDFSAWSAVGSQPAVVQNDVGMAWSAQCAYDGTSGHSGTHFLVKSLDGIDPNLRELYIEFEQKMTAYANSKWVKIHGNNDGGKWANTTFGADGDGTNIMLMGLGTGTTNDAQANVDTEGNWAGGTPPEGVTSPTVTPGGVLVYNNTWQVVRLRVKFSAIGEGILEVWVGGVLKFQALGITNMNAVNLPIDRVGFFDYSNGGGNVGIQSFAKVKILKDGWSTI